MILPSVRVMRSLECLLARGPQTSPPQCLPRPCPPLSRPSSDRSELLDLPRSSSLLGSQPYYDYTYNSLHSIYNLHVSPTKVKWPLARAGMHIYF